MEVYAEIDTNVLVSALLASHPDAAPVRIFEHLLSGSIIPMYNDEILAEYNEVLLRARFHFNEKDIMLLLNAIIEGGIHSERIDSPDGVKDPKDVVFYEVAMSRDDSFIVTGNI